MAHSLVKVSSRLKRVRLTSVHAENQAALTDVLAQQNLDFQPVLRENKGSGKTLTPPGIAGELPSHFHHKTGHLYPVSKQFDTEEVTTLPPPQLGNSIRTVSIWRYPSGSLLRHTG